MPLPPKSPYSRIEIRVNTRHPRLVHQAAVAAGAVSRTLWLQQVMADAIGEALGIDPAELMDEMPANRGTMTTLFGHATRAQNIKWNTMEQ